MNTEPPNGKGEPRWDRDYTYGVQGELQIHTLLDHVAKGNGQVEIKRKRYCDLEFYIETHCDKRCTGKYQPSGISITTAKVWFFVIGDTEIVVGFPTDDIRMMLTDPQTRDREQRKGDYPTKGKLINLGRLLHLHNRRHQRASEGPGVEK